MATPSDILRNITEPFTRGGRDFVDRADALSARAAAERERLAREQAGTTGTSGPSIPKFIPPTFFLPGPEPTGPALDTDYLAENRRNFTKLAQETAIKNWLDADEGGGSGGGGAGRVSFTPISAPQPLTFDPMGIDRSLYALEETAAERQALLDARADLDARARAGAEAIANTWRTVEQSNRAAAEKSRLLAEQYGMDAAGLWIDAANQAREASVLRAAAAMANAGRAPIDLDPLAGGADFIAAMESLASPERTRAYAEGAMQAERADDFAAMAGRQSAAYQGELQRTSVIMAADMAREHNTRVLDRIGRERLALSEAERETGMFNRQMQEQVERGNIERQFGADQFNIQNRMQAEQFNAQMRQTAASAAASSGTSIQQQLALLEQALGLSAFTGNTSVLRQAFPNLSEAEAQAMIKNIDP